MAGDLETPEALNARLLEQIAGMQRELQELRAENGRLRTTAQDAVDANRESLRESATGNVNAATAARLVLDARVQILEKALRAMPMTADPGARRRESRATLPELLGFEAGQRDEREKVLKWLKNDFLDWHGSAFSEDNRIAYEIAGRLERGEHAADAAAPTPATPELAHDR